jgi:uncharacterized protein (DUF433 family)
MGRGTLPGRSGIQQRSLAAGVEADPVWYDESEPFLSTRVKSMSEVWRDRITVNPGVLAGKPTVRGLRISVEHILRAHSAGMPEGELLAEYPDLEPDDLRACLAYAADLVESERV